MPLHRLPKMLPGTPFTVRSVVDRPWRGATALWWPAERVLIVAEAIGTAPLFALDQPAGVHPMLRMLPPRSALGDFAPDRLLVGHGPGARHRGRRRAARRPVARPLGPAPAGCEAAGDGPRRAQRLTDCIPASS